MSKMIVLEGNNGVGKTTQSFLLQSALNALGMSTNLISFPTYTDYSALVKLNLDGKIDSPDPKTRAMFWALDRKLAWDNDYKGWATDMMEHDKIIVVDRYFASNYIHQTHNMTHGQATKYAQWCYEFEIKELGLPAPFQTIFLTADIELLLKNLKKRKELDLHENEDFMRKVHDRAEILAKQFGYTIIDCIDKETGGFFPKYIITEKIISSLKGIM